MTNHTYEITIRATSQKEANAKMKALTTLASKLNEKELSKLAWIINNDPVKTAMAKQALGV